MKKKIAILGSTGSIGKTLIDIIKKDKKNFEVVLLTANKNYKEIYKQSKILNVKNLIITDKKGYDVLKRKNKKINIYNNYKSLNKIIKKKIDYSMCSITGLDGLKPTLEIIKKTKTVAIANKESIICGWNLIKKNLKRYKTKFIPVDSEHFSIWSLLRENEQNKIEKIYITASGGPFLNLAKKNFSKITIRKALKHPNWKMGKKISIDSATLMNKVFEVIEAKNIFDISYNKIKILIHPNSYVHCIIKFKNGLIKLLVHDTSMKIPIFNGLYNDESKKNLRSKNLDIQKLNNLDFRKPNYKKFPFINILKLLPKKISLFETVLISANDELVKMFLNKKINFQQLIMITNKVIKSKSFSKYKKITPKKIDNITELSKFVRTKINTLVYKIS